jgi:hypothetical protein
LRSDRIGTGSWFCFDAFSSREPASIRLKMLWFAWLAGVYFDRVA